MMRNLTEIQNQRVQVALKKNKTNQMQNRKRTRKLQKKRMSHPQINHKKNLKKRKMMPQKMQAQMLKKEKRKRIIMILRMILQRMMHHILSKERKVKKKLPKKMNPLNQILISTTNNYKIIKINMLSLKKHHNQSHSNNHLQIIPLMSKFNLN